MTWSEKWDKKKKKDNKWLMRVVIFIFMMGCWKAGELLYYGLITLLDKPARGVFP